MIHIISISPMAVVDKNTTVRARANKLLFQNKSNHIVTLFRVWTMVPGAIFEMGAEDNDALLDVDMDIAFDAALFDDSKPDVYRLEILALYRTGHDHASAGTSHKTGEFFELKKQN